MKFLVFIFCLSFSISVFACSCFEEQSFCNHINGSFFAENGIVCIVEATGNVIGDYNFSATEVKIIDLLFGQVKPGDGNYLNTDSTIWIIAGQGATCYKSAYTFYDPGKQFVIAPYYGEVYTFDANNTIETGYSLYLCTYDVFAYQDTMIGTIINNYNWYYYDPNYEPDIITSNQFPGIVSDCIFCESYLNLPGPYNYPSAYVANYTISSSANINSNVIYKANDRVTLLNGFKTNEAYNFSIRMDGCE